MGNYESKAAPGGQEIYHLKSREIRLMSEIWKSIETDLVYYGTQFYALLFLNHPEYFKYFQENTPHEFQVDVPTMRSKFSLTCGTLAALFVEYSHKSKQREHLLGYVAMVHKDMNLTQKDMENFMSVMMEMLMKKFPQLMTAECCLAYVRHTATLTSRINVLMKSLREVSKTKGELNDSAKKLHPATECFRSLKCNWLPCNDGGLIYGRSPEYWEKKSRHWIVQRAVWATMDKEQLHAAADSPSRRDTVSKSTFVNFSQMSSIETSTSSDDHIRDNNNEREAQKPFRRKKKHFRKQRNLPTQVKDDARYVGLPVTLKSNADNHVKDSSCGKARVPIINSSARERRRKNVEDEVIGVRSSLQCTTTRRLRIKNGTNDSKNEEEFSSHDEIKEKDFKYNLSKSSDEAHTDKTKDRGTFISNATKRCDRSNDDESKEHNKPFYADERRRASFSVKNEPPNGIIVPGNARGRNVKSNKRVSISSAQWFASREFEK